MTTTRSGRLAAALLFVAVLTLGAAALSACGSGDDTAASSSPTAAVAGPVTVTDDSGVEVTLDAPAEAIVSLAPANTEIAFAVGAGDKMVAGTSYDDYPEEAKALPKIGDFANPNVEKIASYSPDLVLAAGGIQADLRSKLEGLGMTVYVVDPKTYEGAIATIENVGKLAGTEDGAAAVTAAMTAAREEVQDAVGDLPAATTFLEIYGKPLMTAGADTFIDDMITIAGGENIGATAGSGFPNFSTEVLVQTDPQVYIADSGSMSDPGDIDHPRRLRRAHGRQGRQGLRHRRQHHRPAGPASGRGAHAACRDDPSGGFDGRMTRLARTGVRPGILLAGGILVVCLVLALALGPAPLSVGRIWRLLLAGPVQGDLDNAIFWQIRMPRVLVASLVGAALAVAGVILQDLFLNPLTDPYVTGVSSGAALGATIGIVLHLSNLPWTTVLAIVGGLGTLVVVWMAARRRGRIDVFVLLLAGVTIAYLASAVVTVLMIKANEDMTAIIYWLMGSFSGRGWPDVRIALVTLPFMIAPLFFTREMDILLQGEKRALELGVEVERTKRMLLVTAGVLTALAVSVSGIIGFVGLVVPHIVRLLVGPGHRGLLPVSLLAGASMMVVADLLSRTVMSPNEIPVGVVTTFVGAPLFVYLLRRGRRV